jgi:nitrate/nitrite transporter NarK
VAEWFPKKERALATGIFNAGANVGAILAPLVIPLIVMPDGTGWQYAFLVTGVFSAMWVVWWIRAYKRPEEHPRVSPDELAFINSDAGESTSTERLPWRRVIPVQETWAFSVAKLTDAVWWFYLFWTGKFLFDQFGLDIRGIGIPLAIIYVLADVGSIGGGWLSSAFIKRGWTINRSRKLTMLLCALCIMPVMFSTQLGTSFKVNERFFERIGQASAEQKVLTEEAVTSLHSLDGREYASAKEFSAAMAEVLPTETHQRAESALLHAGRTDDLYWIAVFLIGLAAAGHQAWSANIFTLVSDVFPKKAVASVTGFGGMVGAVAGIVVDFSLGRVLTSSGPSGYFFAFLVAGSAYLITLGVVHLLMPKMTPLDDQLRRIQ